MSQLKFQLDFLDGIVGVLRRMAGEHEDMARSLNNHAGAAQSLGADGWIVDQVRYAASLLSGHPSLFNGLSSELDHRLQIAHTVADEWQGATTGLRVALTGAMTATGGLLAHASKSTKANQGAQKTEKKGGATHGSLGASTAKGVADGLTAGVAKNTLRLAGTKDWWVTYYDDKGNPTGKHPDCWAFVKQVMGSENLPTPPSNVYDWQSWSHAGYRVVGALGTTSAGSLGPDFPKDVAAIPPRGSFVEFGAQKVDPTPDWVHHSAYYMGHKGDVIYIAESNCPSDAPPAIHEYKNGVQVGSVAGGDVPTAWDPDNKTSAQQLQQYGSHWLKFGSTAVFYQPESSPSAAPNQIPNGAPPQFNLGPAPIAGQSGTLKPK